MSTRFFESRANRVLHTGARMDCLPQNVVDIIAEILVAGSADSREGVGKTASYVNDFLALAGTCRTMRARCMDAAQRALDPRGPAWDEFAGPSLDAFDRISCLPPTWSPQSLLYPFVREHEAYREFASNLRAYLFLTSHVEKNGAFSRATFRSIARCAPREIIQHFANCLHELVLDDCCVNLARVIAERRLPLCMIAKDPSCALSLREICSMEAARKDRAFPYVVACVTAGRADALYMVARALSDDVLFDATLPTLDIVRAIAPVANTELLWDRILNRIPANPMRDIRTICELFAIIPHTDADVLNFGCRILSRQLAKAALGHCMLRFGPSGDNDEWRLLPELRAIRRALHLNGQFRMDASIIVYLGHESAWREPLSMLTSREICVLINEVCTVEQKDALYWDNVDHSCFREDVARRFIKLARRACLRE